MSEIQEPYVPPRPWYKHKLVLGIVLILVIVAGTGAVYAAFNLTGTVTSSIGQTGARIKEIHLFDITQNNLEIILTCSAIPGPAPICTSDIINPGDNFMLRVIVENSGPVPIPLVTGNAFGVLIYNDMVTTTITHTSSFTTTTTSTATLATSATWTYEYTFSIISTAVAGGTLTLTASVTG